MNHTLLLSLTVIIAMTGTAYAMIECPTDACATVRCASVENCKGMVIQKGGYCGCCDICAKLLSPGDSCTGALLIGAPPTVVCPDGYYCDRNSVTCQPIIF